MGKELLREAMNCIARGVLLDMTVDCNVLTEANLHHTIVNRKSIARGLRAAIAIAVQRGNALAMQAGRSRALGRGSALASAA
jgi:predicted PP-loop superfamily ATPase